MLRTASRKLFRTPKLPSFPFSFPGHRGGVVSLSAYQDDRERANESRQALEEVLDTVALSASIREVTVVCHSMGCQLTMEALRSRSTRGGKIGAKVRNVLLVAPDVDFNVFREQMRQVGNNRPRFALFLSQDDHALKISKSIWGGATRLGDVNPEEEPYKSELAHERVMVFDVSHLEGDPHSRAFDDVDSVMGMIERRLATGQQLEEDPKRMAAVAQ
jgi:esterase/lipase superfamily enzyme